MILFKKAGGRNIYVKYHRLDSPINRFIGWNSVGLTITMFLYGLDRKTTAAQRMRTQSKRNLFAYIMLMYLYRLSHKNTRIFQNRDGSAFRYTTTPAKPRSRHIFIGLCSIFRHRSIAGILSF